MAEQSRFPNGTRAWQKRFFNIRIPRKGCAKLCDVAISNFVCYIIFLPYNGF
jgi:hypothetical protein